MTPLAPDSPAAQRRTLVLGVLLLGALALAYLPALRGDFIWDDDAHVTANPTVVGPQGLKEIWTTSAANYFPLVLTNFRVQHALWGLDPLPYHAVTLAFHLANALLLWAVLRRLRVPGAWLGAALWALHPVQAESVAWISELKNTQSGFFFLLSIFFYVGSLHATDSAARRREYFFSLACGFLAILSKPSTVMLPGALALIAWWQRGKIPWRDLVRLAPLFAFGALAGGWAIWEQHYHQGAAGDEWGQTLAQRLIIAGRAPFFYLGKLFFPYPLSFIYRRWEIDATRAVEFVPLVAALVALTIVCVRSSRVRPLAVTVLFFGVMLFPVLGFFNVYFFRYSYVSDHFQYLASMAPLALLGAALTTWAPRFATAGATALLVVLGLLTWRETHKYVDDETLWRTTIAYDPHCWIAQNDLGTILANRGDSRGALAAYQTAVEANPNYVEALSNLGTELTAANRVPEAIACLTRAREVSPTDTEVLNNLANALRCAGRSREAIPLFETALERRPNFFEAHVNLAHAFVTIGRPADAIVHFQRAIQLSPGIADLHSDLAAVLRAVGRSVEAVDHADEALKLRAANPKPLGRTGPRP